MDGYRADTKLLVSWLLADRSAAIALHTFYYNFIRIHQTLKVTPAMAAGVTGKLWEMDDLVEVLERWEFANKQREYSFVVRMYDIAKGYCLSVFWKGGEVEYNAMSWIKDKSAAWVHSRKRLG